MTRRSVGAPGDARTRARLFRGSRSLQLALAVVMWGAGCVATSSTSGVPTTVDHPTTSPLVVTTTSTIVTGATPPVSPTTQATTTAKPVLPDSKWTPGVTNPDVSQATIGTTICISGWTATVRPPATYTDNIKELEAGSGGSVTYRGTGYQVHGFHLSTPSVSVYELDHLIPLELGGAPADPRNLWMQPYEAPKGPAAPGTSSQTKDKVENAARQAVCAGRLALVDAQREVATDWNQLGQTLGVT